MAGIRPYQPADRPAVVGVWHRAGLDEHTYLPDFQSLTLDRAGEVFRTVIESACDLWVATDDGEIVAFLAMAGSYLDRLYVDPRSQQEGWGTRLVDFAKRRCPDGLELHTHVENTRARQFYERRGFAAVEFGVSPPPESMPDVKYRWDPIPPE